MRVLLLIIFFLIPKLLQAQNDSIVGKVMDRNRTPIEFVTISLLSANDSSLVKGTITDEKGEFILSRKDVKNCIIRASHIEYKTVFTSVPPSIKDVEFVLEPSIISMNEVIVKSNFIKHEYDRIIVNMKGNPVVKGRTVNEALGMLPGVINMNDELRLNGGTVSKIYINGRELHDRTELSSLQATNIENVEILPEADLQHNATTKGGIIYIHLKKNADGGGNGSPSLLGQMRKRNSHRERFGLPLSLRFGKWNFYNNLVLSNSGNPYITENITHNSHLNTHIVNQNVDRNNIRRINETFSMLYDITTLQSIGLNCMVKQAGSTLKSSSFSEIQETEKEYTSSYHSKGKGDEKIYQASLNYNWKSKNGKNTLQTVLDYLRSDETQELNYHYLYQYPDKNEENNKCSNNGTVSDLWKAEINYIFLLNEHSRLKWGGYYYNNHTDNQMYYAYQSEEGWQKEDKSGLFTYKGIGYAGYAEYVWQWKKFTLNGGIRVQEDEVKCISNNIAGDKRTYRNLFPSIKLGYLFSEKNQASLSYSKRMGNIPYKNMNPAIVYISEYSYAKGNPDLVPTTEHRIRLLLSLSDTWSISYTYGKRKDDSYPLVYQDKDNPIITYTMPTNIGKSYRHAFSIGFTKALFSWWTTNASLDGDYTKEVSPEQTYHVFHCLFFCDNSLRFTNTFGGSFNFMAERRARRSETIYHSVYNMNAGLYKYFLDQKFCINLSVYAILNKRRNLTTITNDNLNRIEENNKTPYQGACLNLIYKFDFGKKVKVKRAESIQTTSDSYLRK
ncbi:outer membrane beta-barrel protein [Phocaeicola sartorii]|uniref:outer membrane beta-barrel protein n=1 Tax=Phocaeicola sartorii TaxID=671267 RepID=UPI00248CA13C|nr:outer membrane beta-barrel family protein [Phocaeicola sartorii]